MEDDYTWAADAAGDLYVGTLLTTADFGLSTQIQKKTTQTLDPGANGNVTQTQVFDWGNLSTPARTYTSTYLTNNQNYTARWMFNRLVQTQVTADGTHFTTLVQNTYDGASLTDRPGIYEHDSNYNTSFQYRGNVTSTTSPGSTTNITYDIGGKVVASTTNGLTTNVSTTSATNFAAPSQITTATSSSAMNYSSFLGVTSVTGQNGDSGSVGYDATARPSTSTSPYGAQTTYNYYDTAVPPYKQATTSTNGHWAKTIMDGFGRTIETQTGNGTTVVSNVDTNYAPCGCSPLGKMNATSMPYAVLANRVWTNYYYDGLGRTTSTVAPDGSTTTYAYGYPYLTNTVTVTDPAGKWKQFTTDAFGNLTYVVEPMPGVAPMPAPPSVSPANPYDPAKHLKTQYTYDMLNHLIQIPMLSGSAVQTRSFNYIDPATGAPGALLRSATNPENGTVSYTYNANNLLSAKTDAKNQQIQYSYDSYNRVTQVRHYPVSGGSEDTSQQINYSYDTNPYDTGHTFSQYTQGRLAAISYSTTVIGALNTQGPTFQEWYSYHQAGAQTAKRLHVSIGTGANLDGIYTYDNEGKMATVAYPNSGPTFTNSFDNMSRPTGMTQGSGSVVSSVSYGPANELLGITSYGAVETRGYNNLLQVTSIAFTGTSSVNMQYSYPAGANNGKINSQTDVVSGEVVQYTYDSLNRLATAQTTSSAWGQSYVYDPFGNLYQINVTKGSAPTLSVVIDPTTNRISGGAYDANGNVTNGYTYDVENRMITAVGSADAVYAYSPSNQRVWKGTYTISGGNWTQTAQEVYFYGVDGKKLGTYQMAPNPPLGVTITPTELRAYFGSKPVGYAMGTNAQSATFTPYAVDRLGSNRGVGKFYPYGQDEGTPAPNDEVKFATYTRDSATGLDYAVNRYYSNSLGRFMSPDPTLENVDYSNPQSWNAYSYANLDPVNSNDPDGLETCGDLPIISGTFAGQTVSQVMKGTSGNDLLAQEIWHEGGTIYTSDLASQASVSAYEQDLAAIGTAILNQWDVDDGRLKVSQNGKAVCPLGQCLDRSLQQVIIAIATYTNASGHLVHTFDSSGHMIDSAAAKLATILSTDISSPPLVLDNGNPINQACEGVVASLVNASNLLDGTEQRVKPNGLILLYWNKLPANSKKFYPGYSGWRDARSQGETFWGLPPIRQPPPPPPHR